LSLADLPNGFQGGGFIDFQHLESQNDRVQTPLHYKTARWLGALLLACLPGFLSSEADAAETTALTTLYWCPNQPGKELQVKSDPGCQSLVEAEKKPDDKKPSKPREPISIKPEQVETSVSKFLKEYRDFLTCCANDPTFEQLDELEERASALIKETVKNMSVASIYMSRNQSLIVPVARARDELRDLKRKTNQLLDAKDRVEESGFEQAGRERRKAQDLEDSIKRDFVPKRGPSRAATGADIGQSGPTGTSIGTPGNTAAGSSLNPRVGPEAGAGPPSRVGTEAAGTRYTPRVGTDIGSQPPTINELIDQPTGIDRGRDNSLTTTKPVTSGKVGPDIESTMGGGSSTNSGARTGAEIGDSSFNR
jgi:hypothetical protein